GMIFGAGAAVILRIIFTGIVASLMALPYLKLVGGLALLMIAAKLLVPEQEDEEGVESASHLWAAIQIVVVADIVMSLDNVIAVAAAASGSLPLLILGLAISIPLIVAGAALIMALLNRLPILVWAGAADQLRQLLESAADAIRDQIDQAVIEHQHQLAAPASKVGCRQYAGPRGRYQVGDAKGRAEHAGTLDHRRRQQLANNRRRFVLFAQARIAIKYRQRDKHPAWMSDRTEISVGDETERLLAAVVGMNPPPEIG